ARAQLDRRVVVAAAAVLERVLAQVPQQLVQVRGIDAYIELAGRIAQTDRALVDLGGLVELGEEFAEPASQLDALGPRRVPPRQLQHVIDDGADALAVAGDDVGEAPFLRR